MRPPRTLFFAAPLAVVVVAKLCSRQECLGIKSRRLIRLGVYFSVRSFRLFGNALGISRQPPMRRPSAALELAVINNECFWTIRDVGPVDSFSSIFPSSCDAVFDRESTGCPRAARQCPNAPQLQALKIMLDHGLPYLPVLDSNLRIVGVVSMKDLM